MELLTKNRGRSSWFSGSCFRSRDLHSAWQKVYFNSSCLQLVCCMEAATAQLLVFQPHTLQFGSGIKCPGMWGIAPVQGQNILLKYFLSIKMTGFFLRLLPASSWSRAKNKFLMCSIFLFTTWKAARRAAYRFSSGSADLSHTQPPSLGTVYLMVFILLNLAFS